jgi:NADPH:quinone reductase-like Zn-dependent oxidoreductase
MKVWQIEDTYGIEHLKLAEQPDPKPGPGQIVVAMRAASLNYRDLMTVKSFAGRFALPLIPFSVGAGAVVAARPHQDPLGRGDRVCPQFSHALGASLPVLQEQMLIEAEGVSKFPAHRSFEEAATLPCAAVTAWRALAVEGPVGPGDTVLVQGTGGVSILALQFAKARGAAGDRHVVERCQTRARTGARRRQDNSGCLRRRQPPPIVAAPLAASAVRPKTCEPREEIDDSWVPRRMVSAALGNC